MPNLAAFHPQIVHFVVVLLFAGVALRVLSVVWRNSFVTTAATVCLIFGTIAAVFGVQSGTDAHGPIERIPGVRDAVVDHEEHAKSARTVFLVVAGIEIIALALRQKSTAAKYTRWVHVASAVVGVVGSAQLYEAAEHGGALVYSYAGGPGLRTGNPKDVERLLIAGLYNQSREDRKAGRLAEAASLIDEMAKRMPTDPEARLLRVESLMLDRKDYAGALAAVDSVVIEPANARLRARQANLKADVYLGLGKPDSARAVLMAASAAMPTNTRLKARIDSLK